VRRQNKGAIMAGRGPQSFKKRQKEQQRKEKQQEKAAKRVQRSSSEPNPELTDEELIAEAMARASQFEEEAEDAVSPSAP